MIETIEGNLNLIFIIIIEHAELYPDAENLA